MIIQVIVLIEENRSCKTAERSAKNFEIVVNAILPRHVEYSSLRSFLKMTFTAILAAWPDDERDRKRAPVRF